MKNRNTISIVTALVALAMLTPVDARDEDRDSVKTPDRVKASAGSRDPDRERDRNKFVAHEWGTFTTLQDERGRELSGINIDDEPVPSFVHNLSKFLLQPTFLTGSRWMQRMKGAPQQHPRVTMRLETPVIYFHLPDGAEKPLTLDVSVRFLGGWLTEFYPHAKARAPGLKNQFMFGELSPFTMSSLAWEGLEIGIEGKFPETDEHVWTTPRKVDSEPVMTSKGESEQYVFYRGVANRRAPLRVMNAEKKGFLDIRANFGEVKCSETTRVPAMWLVDVRKDGKSAFREIEGASVTSDESAILATIDSHFEEGDYHSFNVVRLKKLMWISLHRDGLYGDEAHAMLETWNRAYFESPGRRIFFVVPREWTDHYLPLSISKVDKIERVMIGRIELITDKQREILQEIATGTAPNASWLAKIPESEARKKFLAGRIHFGDLGVEIPKHYRNYLELGRFRNALIVEEERRRPTPSLTAFINSYGLRPYRWKDQRTASSR